MCFMDLSVSSVTRIDSQKKMSEERPKPATGDIFKEVSLFSSSRYP